MEKSSCSAMLAKAFQFTVIMLSILYSALKQVLALVKVQHTEGIRVNISFFLKSCGHFCGGLLSLLLKTTPTKIDNFDPIFLAFLNLKRYCISKEKTAKNVIKRGKVFFI